MTNRILILLVALLSQILLYINAPGTRYVESFTGYDRKEINWDQFFQYSAVIWAICVLLLIVSFMSANNKGATSWQEKAD